MVLDHNRALVNPVSAALSSARRAVIACGVNEARRALQIRSVENVDKSQKSEHSRY
jgi:hypothetical protein